MKRHVCALGFAFALVFATRATPNGPALALPTAHALLADSFKEKAGEWFKKAVDWSADKLKDTVVKGLRWLESQCERGVDWVDEAVFRPLVARVPASAGGGYVRKALGLLKTCGSQFTKGLLCSIPRRLADMGFVVAEVAKVAAEEGCAKKAWKKGLKAPLEFVKCGFGTWLKNQGSKAWECFSSKQLSEIFQVLLEAGGRTVCRFGGELVQGLLFGLLTGGTTIPGTIGAIVRGAMKVIDVTASAKLLKWAGFPGSKLVTKYVPDTVLAGFTSFARDSVAAACKGEEPPKPPDEEKKDQTQGDDAKKEGEGAGENTTAAGNEGDSSSQPAAGGDTAAATATADGDAKPASEDSGQPPPADGEAASGGAAVEGSSDAGQPANADAPASGDAPASTDGSAPASAASEGQPPADGASDSQPAADNPPADGEQAAAPAAPVVDALPPGDPPPAEPDAGEGQAPPDATAAEGAPEGAAAPADGGEPPPAAEAAPQDDAPPPSDPPGEPPSDTEVPAQ